VPVCFPGGRESRFFFIRGVQIEADIPRPKWAAKLNMMWPVVMGFRMDRVPCENSGCLVRVNYKSSFCHICTTYRDQHDSLPTRDQITRLMSSGQKLASYQFAARVIAGPNPRCGDCAREESKLRGRLCIHRLYPTVLLYYEEISKKQL
jgi:hypothetical protein